MAANFGACLATSNQSRTRPLHGLPTRLTSISYTLTTVRIVMARIREACETFCREYLGSRGDPQREFDQDRQLCVRHVLTTRLARRKKAVRASRECSYSYGQDNNHRAPADHKARTAEAARGALTESHSMEHLTHLGLSLAMVSMGATAGGLIRSQWGPRRYTRKQVIAGGFMSALSALLMVIMGALTAGSIGQLDGLVSAVGVLLMLGLPAIALLRNIAEMRLQSSAEPDAASD